MKKKPHIGRCLPSFPKWHYDRFRYSLKRSTATCWPLPAATRKTLVPLLKRTKLRHGCLKSRHCPSLGICSVLPLNSIKRNTKKRLFLNFQLEEMAAVLLRFLRESRKVQSFGEPSPCVMDITRLYVYIFKGIKKNSTKHVSQPAKDSGKRRRGTRRR